MLDRLSNQQKKTMQSRAKVFFSPVDESENIETIVKKTSQLIEHINLQSLLKKNYYVAIKQHFGEKGNDNYIKPEITKNIVSSVKKADAFPIIADTNTLYKGERSDSYHHLLLASSHGFSIEKTGAPVIILDGLFGQNQCPVKIPGKHFKEVNIVPDIAFFDYMVILTHVKGHMMSGMGGAIKNLGMGFASRAGKLVQHADFKPAIDKSKCILCGVCTRYCQANAISITNKKISVNNTQCTGCGECFTACKNDAIEFEWAQADRNFNEKMAEHAFGAIINHHNRVVYLNFLIDITKHCDCWSEYNPVIHKNVGIFASHDPVAIDKACIDIAREVHGIDIFKDMWPELDAEIQINHGENIGMGTQHYDLIRLSNG